MSYGVYLVLMIVVMVISLVAQVRVKSAYNKYSQVANKSGLTGADVARKILDENGLYDVEVTRISGTLTDNYNPKTNIVSLSDGVYGSNSVAAIGIAAHEVGHAIQHSRNYLPVKLRTALVPVVNFSSKISWVLIMIGLLLNGYLSSAAGTSDVGYLIAVVGVILYASAAVFHLVTLPVELNASARARKQLDNILLPDRDERRGVKRVLKAAAMTYVASLLVALVNLLRIAAVVLGRRR
ncbi:MAG: zinc metallopeptidase [Clostridia bacterium]|nr:zinc metallopeptidase [Clostridia bacterium]MBQ9994612.1 zinc metallopeptidase [Clostridia bacterium]